MVLHGCGLVFIVHGQNSLDRFTPVNLLHVEVHGEPAGDFFALCGGVAGCVVGGLVLLDGIRGEDEDKVLAEVGALLSVEAFFVKDVFSLDGRADVFLCGFTKSVFTCIPGILIRQTGALDCFGAEVFVVVVGVLVEDGIGRGINVTGGDAVLIVIDGNDLVVGQVDVGGQAVAGDLVGLIEAARGNCVCQIGLHQVGGGQFRVFVDQFPGGDVSAVCRDLLAFLRMEIVEGSVVIEDRVKIEAVQLGDIAVREVFGLKILRKKNIGRCGSRGFLQKRRLPGRDVGIVSLSRSVCTGAERNMALQSGVTKRKSVRWRTGRCKPSRPGCINFPSCSA